MSQAPIPISVIPPLLPYAAPDSITINEGAASGFVDVLLNDLAKSAKANLSITSTTVSSIPSSQGSVTQNGSTFTYTPPNADFFGTTSFTYTIVDTVDDGDGPSTGTVNITVNPVNDPPVITKPGATPIFAEDSTANVINGLSVTDVDNANVTVSLGVLHGTLSAGGQSGSTIQVWNSALSGSTYTPAANYFGPDTLGISANDGMAPAVTTPSTSRLIPSTIRRRSWCRVTQSFLTDFDNRFTSTPNPFRITDVDAGNSNVQVDLTIADGAVTLVNSTGVTVTRTPAVTMASG